MISLPEVQGLMNHITVDATSNGLIAVYNQKGADDYRPMVKMASETDTQPSL
jgi:hypothetical protein